MKLRNVMISVAAAMVMLAGCDTGDGAIGNAPAKGNVNGLVVVPVLGENNASNVQCGSLPIPGGYLPLSDANVTYIDENGSSVLSQLTDSCGRFYGTVETSGLKTVTVAKPGYHTMVSDISFFDNGGKGWGIVSTADSNNSFAVRVNSEGASVTFNRKSGNFKYSVVDTKSGHAVLGIPKSQVELYKDKTGVEITDYVFNDLHASLVLSMDASGSMDSDVYDFNGTDYVPVGNRLDFAYLAAKQFVSELSGNAKLAYNIFDEKIDFIDYDYLNNSLGFVDNNKSVILEYAKDGFETDKTLSKFVVDIYYTDTSVYEGNITAELPYVSQTAYPWGGGTALYDVAYESVEKLKEREDKRIAVLMTDGYDTASEKKKSFKDTIDEAIKNDVVFYTIAVGGDIDGKELEYLAKRTGGVFIRAEGTDLSAKFADVLSEIQYFYEVGTPIEENTTAFYRVDVTLDGETVSGIIDFNSTIPPNPQPPVDETEGAQLYTKCMPCHGVYGEQSAYNVTVAINTLDASTLKSALDAYKAGTLDQYGYGELMQTQVATYSDEQIAVLSEYIPTLEVPDTNDTNGTDGNISIP